MGLKDAAKALMERAGVPVVPGYQGDNQDPAFLAERARDIGYPILIKARAGGGGKGMRRVDRPSDFKAAFEGAAREAEASFGDGRCLIENTSPDPAISKSKSRRPPRAGRSLVRARLFVCSGGIKR